MSLTKSQISSVIYAYSSNHFLLPSRDLLENTRTPRGSNIRPIEPPSVVEGGDVFEVEHRLGKRYFRERTPQYLAKWFGYGQ